MNMNDELLQGQAQVLNHMFGFVDSLALRAAVELRIADIIHSHGQPVSLSQIASLMNPPPTDVTCLSRVMLVLVRKKIFTQSPSSLGGDQEALYGLTPASTCLLHDTELSLAPLFLTVTHPWLIAPWHHISHSIKEGGTPFEKAHGETFWERGSKDPDFNNLFNTGMTSYSGIVLYAILSWYKQGFSKLEGTLVDVGGGVGRVVSKIVEAYPHIKGINFDMPHVVAMAPQYSGVAHVGGDMFKEIPNTDTVLIKSVLHNWGDEDCVKILKNCHKALSKKKGKVIIVDIVLHPQRKGLFDDYNLASDLEMMALSVGGKERTHHEWKNLLKQAGFVSYNFITTPTFVSIIEAFPH